jgi:hypothetical protein
VSAFVRIRIRFKFETKTPLKPFQNHCFPFFGKYTWVKAIGLNFESSGQIPKFLFRKALNLSKFVNSLKSKSLGSNFIYEPKSIFNFQNRFQNFPYQVSVL